MSSIKFIIFKTFVCVILDQTIVDIYYPHHIVYAPLQINLPNKANIWKEKITNEIDKLTSIQIERATNQ